MQTRSHKQPVIIQFIDLFLMELTNWRWSWRSTLIIGTLAPVLGILGFGMFARDSGTQALTYILSGNIVIALLFGNMGNLQGHFAFMRFQGMMDYLATLPVRKPAIILAAVLAFLLLSLPSLAVTLLVGWLFLGLSLSIHPLIILVVPICIIPFSSLGALIGVSIRRPEEGSAYQMIATYLLAGLGPTIIPPDRLPAFLLAAGWLNPATYASSALRQVLVGPVTPRLFIDLAVLMAVSIGLLWLVEKRMSGQQN